MSAGIAVVVVGEKPGEAVADDHFEYEQFDSRFLFLLLFLADMIEC